MGRAEIDAVMEEEKKTRQTEEMYKIQVFAMSGSVSFASFFIIFWFHLCGMNR